MASSIKADVVIGLSTDERASLGTFLYHLEQLEDLQVEGLVEPSVLCLGKNQWEDLFRIRKDVFGY